MLFRLSLLLLLSAPVVSLADNWPNWRGPTGDGVAPGGGYVESWGGNENVRWKAQLPGVGGSTPAIWGGFAYITSPTGNSDSEKNSVLCYDVVNGTLNWSRHFGKERRGKHKKGSGSNPSPVTDGKHVYCYFKSGELLCLGLNGKLVWEKNLQEEYGEDTLWWDLGTSPVLTDDAVVVAVVQSGPSYLVAFEKSSGDVLWKQDRTLNAPEEANQTYSTPIVTGSGDDQRLIVLGADHVTCHSAKDGSEMWRVGGMNPKKDPYFRSISSPVLSGDVLVAPYARGSTLTGIRLGGKGDVTESHVAWSIDGPSADVPTPASHDGTAFVLTDKGTVAAVNSADGKVIWQGRLPKNRNSYSASPVYANGKLYVVREDGKAFVLRTDKFQIIAENDLDDRIVATPVFTNGKILFRGAEMLHCIGSK